MGILKSPDELEQTLRAGRFNEVRASLQGLTAAQIPRKQAWRYCNLARRVNLINTALRIANPLVRPKSLEAASATPEESCEYAAALTRIGAIQEAHSILSAFEVNGPTMALLYRAFAYFAQWDYANGARILELATQRSGSEDPYFRRLVELNLASCYVFQKNWQRAEEVLLPTLESARIDNYKIIEGNALELLAQSSLMQNRFETARAYLKEAASAISEAPTLDRLFVDKWTVLADLYEKPHTNSLESRVREVQAQAVAKKHWETVRDCDFHLARRVRSQEIYWYLYMGTPLNAYRDRLTDEFADLKNPPAIFEWVLGANAANQTLELNHWINIASGDSSRRKQQFEVGTLAHRLFVALTADFYRPTRLGALFSALFPGEYFNPFSSPNRIHQCVIKLRNMLQKSQIPLAVVAEDGCYSLRAMKPVILRVPGVAQLVRSQPDPIELKLIQLFSNDRTQALSTAETSRLLEISESSAVRLLRRATVQGKLTRVGSGPLTRYMRVP